MQATRDSRVVTVSQNKHCVFEPARMSPETLEAGTEWVARRFYSPRSITRRLASSGAG